MSNKIPIFNAIVSDATSNTFKITLPDSKGMSDTEFSAYFEIFGGLGGGVLTLEKNCGDNTFRNIEEVSAIIATDFPAAADVLVLSFNYKDAETEFQFKLTGATPSTATLSVYGINMNQN